MAKQESFGRILGVAFAICVVCSVLVSTAAVMLKPVQTENKALDFKRNVLRIAGIELQNRGVEEVFAERIEAKVVDLETGKFSDAYDSTFDQIALTKSDSTSIALSAEEDDGKILRRENFSVIYLVKNAQGEMETLILPFRGKGLWSTMKGLVILEKDLNTIAGLGFYEHAETPGLGGEIDNPSWQAQWVGKKIYDENGVPAVSVVKAKNPALEQYQVDSLSGATLTSNGVSNALHFWLGDKGFKKFLKNLNDGEA
ncbi:MAG: Na(+)-translocating NADH-quinone reductase subunit C [Cellvibrio sp.]